MRLETLMYGFELEVNKGDFNIDYNSLPLPFLPDYRARKSLATGQWVVYAWSTTRLLLLKPKDGTNDKRGLIISKTSSLLTGWKKDRRVGVS